MGKIIGIDLGTTNSVVAVMEGGQPKVIPTAEGSNTCPSVVAVNKTSERLVGTPAKRQGVTNPEHTIFSVKRFIGRQFDEPEVQKTKSLVPYTIKKAGDGSVRIVMGEKDYSPQEISAFILQKLKADAESYLGEKVTEAVITVPAYFNDSERQATKDAGTVAGLDVKRIINEPTASALAYGLDKQKEGKVVVYDLGGGTFDVTVLEIGDGVFEVKATAGDTHLGGDDFDHRIMDWIIGEFKKDQSIDLKADKIALQRIKETAEKAKIELSSNLETEINLPFITADAAGPKHLVMKLSRAKLEALVDDLIERTKGPSEQALKDAKLTKGEIDEVILVGGQTRMPKVQALVTELFGREPHKGVNPDEVVALGAAIQGGVLGGEVKNLLLLDVTPLTLGIETMGGVLTPLIERNTTIPTSKSQTFSTAADSQPSVEVHVLQGERPLAADNRTLGKFNLDGIPPAPRGVPQIDVTFDIDANGILHVSAKDKATGKEQNITITASSGLSKEEIERMRREAESHAADDEQKKTLIEARNQADALIYSSEKALKDAGDKVKTETKTKVEEAIKALKETLGGNDAAAITKATDELSATIQAVGSELYSKSEDGGQQSGDGAKSSDNEPTSETPPTDK